MRHFSIALVVLLGGVWTVCGSELPLPPDPNVPQSDFSQLEFDANSGLIIGDYRQFERQQRFSLYTTLAQAGQEFPTDYMQDPELKAQPVADANASAGPAGVTDPLDSVPPPPVQVAAGDASAAPKAPPVGRGRIDSGYRWSCTSSSAAAGCSD